MPTWSQGSEFHSVTPEEINGRNDIIIAATAEAPSSM